MAQGGVERNTLTPRHRVLGLGPSRTGSGAFIGERVSSIALVPLGLWAAWAAVVAAPGGYAGATAFLHAPFNAAMAVLLLAVGLYHAHLGMRVIIEDYIGHHGRKLALILLSLAVAGLFGAVGVVSILKVAFAA
jgi:succinate dehydrogenase / fumarate reductase, membrane anchor subunit